MPRPFHIRRIAKWSGIAISLLILSLGGLGLRYKYGFEISATNAVNFSPGQAMLFYGFPPMSGPHFWITDTGWRAPDPRFHSIRHSSFANGARRSWVLFVPLWIPFLLVGVPTAVLYHLDRRRIPPGHCRKCGY